MLFVTTEFPFPARNGVTNKPANYLRHLKDHFRITLLSYVEPDAPPQAAHLEEAREVCEQIHTVPQHGRSTLRSVGRLAPPFTSRYRSAAAFGLVRMLTVAEHYAVAHFDAIGSLCLRPAVQISATTTVASPSDSYALLLAARTDPSLHARVATGLNRTLVRAYEKRTYGRFDQVHFVSQVDCAYVARMVPGVPVHRVPLGVDAERFAPSGVERPHDIVYIANMADAHGELIVRFVDEALPLIHAAVPTARLLVIGANPPAQLVARARGDDRLVVTGWVADIATAAATGAIALSLATQTCGMLNKVLEAMAMGKAVVGRPQNFVAFDGARDGSHFVAAPTMRELAAAVVALLREPARASAIGSAARELMVSEFSWRRAIDRYLDVVGAGAGAAAGAGAS